MIIDNDGRGGPAGIAGDAFWGNACFFDQLAQGALGRIGFVRFEMAAGAEPYLKLLVMDGQVALLLVHEQGARRDVAREMPARGYVPARQSQGSQRLHIGGLPGI